jgi:elongation factor G
MADGVTVRIDESKPPCAFAFKTVSDPFVGRLTFLKIISGVLEPGIELVCGRTGKRERLGKIQIMMGKEPMDVKSAKAGDIVVVPKLADVRVGDTLSCEGTIAIEPLPLPEAMYPVAIEVSAKKDEDKLGTFLARAAEADPTIRIERNDETHQSVLYAMGETQVAMLLERLREQSGIEAHLVDVRIPYRETIKKTAEAQGRHKKQTGGAGQFGDCWLRLAPNPGEGYVFVDEIKGGAIPNGLIPAVDKGVREAMAEGFLAGYPMVDISCTVFDGSYHSVDSNEMAFKTAARIGFRAACEKAAPTILEPFATMDVTVPEEFAGTVMGDVATRRGRIVGTDAGAAGQSIIKVRVPYAEVINYTHDLRSMTRGAGSYTLTIDGYEEAPMDVQKKLIEAYKATRE